MWLWSNIVFWVCCTTLSADCMEEDAIVYSRLQLNKDFYIEIAMVPFSKNRRFFIHQWDTVKHENPEWIRTKISKDRLGNYVLGFHQKEMKNALKQNANFRLNNLFLDRAFDFSPTCFSSDSSTTRMQLSPQRAHKFSADSIFYLLKTDSL